MPKKKLKLRWRHSFGYWYYEDEKNGYGHVARGNTGQWIASCFDGFIYAKTLAVGKAYVEKCLKGSS